MATVVRMMLIVTHQPHQPQRAAYRPAISTGSRASAGSKPKTRP